MIIKKVDKIEEAIACDKLLTKLVNDEKKYDDNINENFVVKDWYKNLYSKNNNILYIALDDNKIIGYIYIKITTLEEGPEIYPEALIDGLFVDYEYRHQGIATALMNKAKEWSAKNDVKYIKLNVLSKNLNAINLYKKIGFEDFSVNLKYTL